MCTTGWTRSLLPIASLALCLLHVSVDKVFANDCDHPEELQKINCTGHVIKRHSVRTENQCIDFCLRFHLCDGYIFHRQTSQPNNCKLLNINAQARISSSGHTPRKISGLCGTMLFPNGQKLRDFVLGTNDCPDLRSDLNI